MNKLYFPFFKDHETMKTLDEYPDGNPALQSALCGLLCINSQADRITWYKTLFKDFRPNKDEILRLTALFDKTVQELNGMNFNFKLVLPNDNAPLFSRIIAISDWCKGLILGLDIFRLIANTKIPQNCQEYIEDVVKISRISNLDFQNNNDEDTDFENIVEYLRIGLLLLYEELQPLNVESNYLAQRNG